MIFAGLAEVAVLALFWPFVLFGIGVYWFVRFFKAQLLVTLKWAVLPLLCGYGLYLLYRRYSPRAQEASEAKARGEGNDKNQSQQGQSQQQSRTNNSHSYSDQNGSNGSSQSRQQQSRHQHSSSRSSNYSSGRSQTNSRAQAEKSPWEILGVRQGASYDEIKKAFRHAIRQYHPDRVNDLGKEFQDLAHQKAIEIQQAYERLTKYH